MTGIDFFKREHWILKVLYVIGLIMFLIHLFYFFKEVNDNRIFPIVAYGTIAIFYLRFSSTKMKEKQNK
jgi:uncharacterized membrane protein